MKKDSDYNDVIIGNSRSFKKDLNFWDITCFEIERG